MKQTTGAQGAWAGKEETTAHLTQKELDCPGARITQHLRARHDRREAGSTQAHPGDTQKYKNSVGARVGMQIMHWSPVPCRSGQSPPSSSGLVIFCFFGWMVTMSSPLSLKRHLVQLLIYNAPSPSLRTTNSTADVDCHDLLTIHSGTPEFGNDLLPSKFTFLTLQKIPAP